jgi:hypothetical protein
MKNYMYLSIDNYQEISIKLHQYLINHSTIYTDTKFWTWQNPEKILEHIPELAEWLKSQSLTPVWMSAITVEPGGCLPMHVDTVDLDPAMRLRILWPVHGCEGSTNILYDVPQEDCLLTCGNDKELYYEIYNESSEYKELERFELHTPVILDTGVAHAVIVDPESLVPRVTLTIYTAESLEKYLTN